MSKMNNFWKIFNWDSSVCVLTYVPDEYFDKDGVYKLMKQLQKVYGYKLSGYQKFDERFDKAESFNRILRTSYNLDGNRLICAHLFDFNPETNELVVDNAKKYKIVDGEFGYVYRVRKNTIKTDWDTFRRHILWTMGEESCMPFWGDELFGEQKIIQLDKSKRAAE